MYIQVDEIGYDETVKQKGLKQYWDQIKAKLGIDWTETEWKDLEKPLYSGLAARLYLARISAPIPSDLTSQAQYWKTYYNTSAGKGTVQKFINDVKQATGCAVQKEKKTPYFKGFVMCHEIQDLISRQLRCLYMQPTVFDLRRIVKCNCVQN